MAIPIVSGSWPRRPMAQIAEAAETSTTTFYRYVPTTAGNPDACGGPPLREC